VPEGFAVRIAVAGQDRVADRVGGEGRSFNVADQPVIEDLLGVGALGNRDGETEFRDVQHGEVLPRVQVHGGGHGRHRLGPLLFELAAGGALVALRPQVGPPELVGEEE
jgi:hypothetical protein